MIVRTRVMAQIKNGLASVALAALLSALLGCGSSLTGPQTASTTDPPPGNPAPSDSLLSPPILTVNVDGTADFVQVSESEIVTPVLLDPQSASAKIDGNAGGKVGCGRFEVVVPPGAFWGSATVTITIPDPTRQLCDLSISPSYDNNFRVPVQLISNVKDCVGVDATTLTTYWYDAAGSKWVDMKATTDASSGTVTANLHHFSKYGTGKAGW